MMKYKGIFIKNIYYMLAYAFQSLRHEKYKKVAAESFDNIHDLFAGILDVGIRAQLKQGLYKEYINRQESLSGLRGKIHMPWTIKNRLAHKQLLTCEFDELSENNILNQILKTTVMLLLKHGEVKAERKDALKKTMLYFGDVDRIELSAVPWDLLRFPWGFPDYLMLINICHMLVDELLPTTSDGVFRIHSFMDKNLPRLYEKFILEYYRRHYPMLKANASRIDWAVDDVGRDMHSMLPTMQSDIQLQLGNTVLIIDAKFYRHSTLNHHDKQILRSNHMYQIFAYVKNRDYAFEDEEHKVSGMLLYAKTEDELQPNNMYKIHGSQISVKNLDLNVPFEVITKQLNEIAESHFELGR